MSEPRVPQSAKRDRASGESAAACRAAGPDEGTGRHMSGPDESRSGPRAFWRDGRSASRRQNSRKPAAGTPPAGRKRRIVRLARTARRKTFTPEFDLSTLPKLEETDGKHRYHRISAQKAFPKHLRNGGLAKNPGRWNPAIFVITSIPRSNTPMTGKCAGRGFPVATNSAQVSMWRGWCRRSWGEPAAEPINFRCQIVLQIRRQASPVEPSEHDLSAKTAGRSWRLQPLKTVR